MSNLTQSDLHFLSSSQPTLSTVLSTLRRSNLTIHNRLTSCLSDSAFVLRVQEAFSPSSAPLSSSENKEIERSESGKRRLVANERCGSWYVRPSDKGGSAYFKSTDGHERAWKFSTRRLNLHLVEMIERGDGIIIVDSTRRGKRMPDALSTTIPIWCTVLNQHLLPSHPLSSRLHLPSSHSPSTHAQITSLIPTFLRSLQELNLKNLPVLTKPLRPFWVTQDSSLEEAWGRGQVFEDYRPVICCTASRRVTSGKEADEGGYIQGAGDDTENWAHGLTPDVFWANVETLLGCEEDDLPELIHKLFEEHKRGQEGKENRIRLTPNISVTTLPLSPSSEEAQVLLMPEATKSETWETKGPQRMELGVGTGKAGSKSLRIALPKICESVAGSLKSRPNAQVVIACESGKDLSVGTALALSCYLFDDAGVFMIPDEKTSFTKSFVKIRLGGIMTTFPAANPSRNTLQSVNSFLMDWRK